MLCEHCPNGEVKVGWNLDQELSKCPDCGHVYRVWGDETYDDETGECYEWWWITEPDAKNPWL